MHPGLLDVLHHGRDIRLLPVAERVHVDLDRSLEEPVDEHALTAASSLGDGALVVTDLHVAAPEHVRRAHEHRVADRLRDVGRLLRPVRHGPGGDGDVELVAERSEPFAVLGEVDGVERRPEDPPAFCLNFARKF